MAENRIHSGYGLNRKSLDDCALKSHAKCLELLETSWALSNGPQSHTPDLSQKLHLLQSGICLIGKFQQ